MSIGIDKIGFATSQYVLNMADLALARGAEPEKFSKGLMLDATSITPITEDIVTLASDAATKKLSIWSSWLLSLPLTSQRLLLSMFTVFWGFNLLPVLLK